MSRVARCSPAALTAVLILAGCGGGGSSPVQPQAHATAAPASSRTSVGTATLTLVLPKVLTAKKAQAVVKKTASARTPQFVDPQPSPGQAAGANLIDIYVDGSLLYNLDGNAGTYGSSIEVTASATGVQTVAVPLFSTSNNMIVAVEFDGNHNSVLAIGESNLGTFSAGSTNNVSLTMLQNATALGIVDLPGETAPVAMNPANNGWGLPENYCYYGGQSQIGVYTVDTNNNFVPGPNGYGGTGFATVTGVSDNSGSTSITTPQTQFPGLYTINWDTNCDSIELTGTAPNPANAIYADVENNQSYTNGTGGTYQGVYNILQYNPYNSYSQQYFSTSFTQLNQATVSGSIDAQGGYAG